MVVAAQPAQAGHQGNPGALGPGGQPYGRSYGEWGAAWWRWAGSFPYGQDPITEGGGEVVYGGPGNQPPGPVWFLAGNFAGGEEVHRILTVPRGTALFMPLVNFLFWAPEDCEFLKLAHCRATDLKREVREIQGQTVDLVMSVDGKQFAGPDRYTGLSKPFTVTIKDGDLFSAFAPPGDRYPTVSGGHWMMLAPLSKGTHTLHWGGHSTAPDLPPSEPQNMTYTITVT